MSEVQKVKANENPIIHVGARARNSGRCLGGKGRRKEVITVTGSPVLSRQDALSLDPISPLGGAL